MRVQMKFKAWMMMGNTWMKQIIMKMISLCAPQPMDLYDTFSLINLTYHIIKPHPNG